MVTITKYIDETLVEYLTDMEYNGNDYYNILDIIHILKSYEKINENRYGKNVYKIIIDNPENVYDFHIINTLTGESNTIFV